MLHSGGSHRDCAVFSIKLDCLSEIMATRVDILYWVLLVTQNIAVTPHTGSAG